MHVFVSFSFDQLKPECLAFETLQFCESLNAMYRTLPLLFNALEHGIYLNNA
jgi:hypothetical protein